MADTYSALQAAVDFWAATLFQINLFGVVSVLEAKN